MDELDRILNEEMMRNSPEDIRRVAHDIWLMYSEFVKAGFTKQQAMTLIKHMLKPTP